MNEQKHEEERVCLNCGKPISGRADKRFCCSRCKNEWNNSLNGPARHRRNRVLGILDKNYQVLKMVLESGEKRGFFRLHCVARKALER